jgi:hypothetical protein
MAQVDVGVGQQTQQQILVIVSVLTWSFPGTPKNTGICNRISYFKREQTLKLKVQISNFKLLSFVQGM